MTGFSESVALACAFDASDHPVGLSVAGTSRAVQIKKRIPGGSRNHDEPGSATADATRA